MEVFGVGVLEAKTIFVKNVLELHGVLFFVKFRFLVSNFVVVDGIAKVMIIDYFYGFNSWIE